MVGNGFTIKTRTNHFINDSNRSALTKYMYLAILFILLLSLSYTLEFALNVFFADMDGKSHTFNDNCENFIRLKTIIMKVNMLELNAKKK